MKSESQPEMSSNQPAVTTGGFRGRLRQRRTRKLLLAISILVILAAAALGYSIFRELHPNMVKPHYDTSGLPVDYSLMNLSQLNLALLARTNVTLEQLKDNNITPDLFDNFDQAYVAAQVLSNSNVNLQAKSLQAYKIAALQATSSQATYKFYINYAYEYIDNNDTASAIAQLNNAKKAVAADHTLNSAGKADMNSQIDTLIATWKR